MMMSSNKDKNLPNFLIESVKRRKWEEVIKKCEEEIEALSVKLTQAKDTALHLAAYDNNVEVVERLVRLICMSGKKKILELKNERENTPLHVAAAMGCARMCHVIGSVDEKLVDERNKDGETPLFLAALHDHRRAFYCLYEFCRMDLKRVEKNCRRSNGDTILHCALKTEYFDLAFQIINMNKEAAIWVDEQGHTALHVLASKPSAFRSGAYLVGWQYIAYHCICVDKLKPKSASTHGEAKKSIKPSKVASLFPENYATCIDFVTNLWQGFLIVLTLKQASKKKEESNPCNYDEAKGIYLEKDVDERIEIMETHESNPPLNTQLLKPPGGHPSDTKPPSSIFPQNYDTCINFFQMLFTTIMIIMGFGFAKIRKLREKKEKHTWSVQVMEKLLEVAPLHKHGQNNGDSPMISILQNGETLPYTVKPDSIDFNRDGFEHNSTAPNNIPKLHHSENKVKVIAKETPMLLAAKNGVVEMVSRLYQHFPMAIHDSNPDKKNVVLLAAEFRQPDVYKFLLRKRSHLETLFRAIDKNGDSALHLAARLQTRNTWRIKGVAFQMKWEAKWYQYVRDSVEPYFFAEYNNEGNLAKNIFHDTHKELAKTGGEWLIKTSKSCSFLAGLVVTAAYVSATTVPGGNKDDGTPHLENWMGFFIFSLASLIALCFSTTSLIMFLAILTSRFNEEDFSSRLPGKLLVGLSSLFLSIVAMLVSFSASHYFLLTHHLQDMAVFIYIATSLPVVLFFVIVELPLYFDLLIAFSVEHPKRRNEVIVIN